MLNGASIPKGPDVIQQHPRSQEDLAKMSERLLDIEDAEWAYEYYSFAWYQHQYRRVLYDFKKESTVQRDWSVPNGSWQTTNVDVNPAAGCHVCDKYMLRCFISGTGQHFCKDEAHAQMRKNAMIEWLKNPYSSTQNTM